MTFFHFAYNFLASIFALMLFPVIWLHEKKDVERSRALIQRLGYDLRPSDASVSGGPKIWIHAVSVGEVKAADAILHALDACGTRASILITTTTISGQRHAHKCFDGRAMVRYAPVDLWGSIGRFLSNHRPDLLVCMETEIWPNWIMRAHGAGIKIIFLNGRISTRTIRSYLTIRPLIKPVLEKVHAFSMISEPDARRIIALGAPPHRVQINGNVKMDAMDWDRDESVIEPIRRLFAVDADTPVFVAGSIRGAEADMLMAVYDQMATQVPGMVFIIAPRHIEKSSRIAEIAREKGISCQFRTELAESGGERQAPMVILNTIGELRHIYGIASVVFCGGSLVALGGQNVVEAAMWAKPVLFGPSMEDFEEARIQLETSGGGICVRDANELADRASDLLTHPAEARRLGRLARRALLLNQGAASRHARVVAELLSTSFDSHQ